MSVEIGSIWKENDRRLVRFIRVVEIGETNGEGWARIALCNPASGWYANRTTKARLRRFGKSYKQVLPE